MKKLITFIRTLSLTIALGVIPFTFVNAQNQNNEKAEIYNNLPKLIFDSSLGNFHGNFQNEDASVDFLMNHFSKWLGTDSDHTYTLISNITDDLGISHAAYQHYYKGIKVVDEIILLHSKNGKLTYVNGELSQNIKLDIVPTLSKSIVESIVSENLKASKITYTDFEQVITKVIKDRKTELHLTSQINALSMKPLKSYLYFIDNTSKEIVKKLPKILHVDTPSTSATLYKGNQQITVDSHNGSFRLKDNTRNIHTLNGTDWDGNGNLSTGELTGNITEYTSNTPNFTETATKPAVEVHWGMKNAYDYYINKHNRVSYDGNGSIIRNYYNINFNTPNQPVNGAQAAAIDTQGIVAMVYGNGMVNGSAAYSNPVVGLDIAGHEYSHLIIGRNGMGGLNYQAESGALNESIADMFGTAIEFYSGVNPNWTVGEGIPKPVIGTFIRSMSNPNSGPAVLGSQQPDTYLGTYWASTAPPYDNTTDFGGVHTNSGVGNYWFYLLSMGGSGTNDIGNAFNVTGISIQKAEKIIYRTLTTYLTPNSSYIDAYNGTKQAVTDLYGATSNEQNQNVKAWYAVGIGNGVLATNETNLFSENGIKIYPNPIKDGIYTIDSNSSDWSFEIFDMSGKLIRKSEKLSKGKNRISANGIKAGVYLLKFVSETNETFTKKLIFE
ncbi:Por secretion system C-terminal sorting domain-containing protein [Chryseobacterium taichungense]|uniref:Por secretion system C-terminal sorting domain-containing protein n=1 Tax=Chryseobacterium taichungense TaxID=295069 RepID=A0A1H7XEC0_9FLAO|nr:M4 family metallopeptidase [Chryseobacterium taichungense]SEM32232.1 Por secretion system C-terminal sorting domain-containing protein [Chryseobacterium taichungense]